MAFLSFELLPGWPATNSVKTILRDLISLALFFVAVAVAIFLNSNNNGAIHFFRKPRAKLKSEVVDRDIYMIRPGCNADESFDISSSPQSEVSSTASSSSESGLKSLSSSSSSEVEIRHSLKAAKDFVAQGKFDRATKVYQHIISLHPKHPDVLTAYGQLLEEGYDDVVEAEHLYSAALIMSPLHEHAAERRRRTLPLVEKIDQRNFDRVSKKMKRLSQIPRHNSGLKRAKLEAYIQHIYHTNAMEGNTMTLMQTRAIVETGIAVGGKSVYEHNEVLGMDAALQYINRTRLHQAQYVTVKDILEIHKRVLGFVNLEEAGRFRQTQVFVGSHRPPPPAELDSQVSDFVDWLNAEREDSDATGLHPLELAALAHYKFVYIHPFYDGNGRVSRLLMNLVLLQAGYPPVIIDVKDKHEYYQRLQMANDGDVRPFIRFVADCTERTLDQYLSATSTSSGITVPGAVTPEAPTSWTFTTEKRDGRKKIVLMPPVPQVLDADLVGGAELGDGQGDKKDMESLEDSGFGSDNGDDGDDLEDEIIDEN